MVSLSRWKTYLATYGVTPEQIEKEQKLLSKKFGKNATYEDTIWSILNELLLVFMKNGNLHFLKMVYYNMALFLDEEGKNSFDMRQLSSKTELMYYKQDSINSGILSVEILACTNQAKNGSCAKCIKMNSKKYTIDDALKEMPIPVKGCTHHLYSKKYSFCRCCWVAVID